MPNIADMTLEQLQDYALGLEQERDTACADLETSRGECETLRQTNLMLQNRNNELFLRVEQAQRGTAGTDPHGTEEDPETVEEYAVKNFKNILG